MDPKSIAIGGLVLNMIGVAVVWRFGWPQPELATGVALGLEDGTPYGPNGETVADNDRRVVRLRVRYRRASGFGLGLLLAGFCVQVIALLV
jgi:hypothetical protein